jgi:predicted RNA-binding protein YlqC (UPF0109 family)
MSEHGRDLDAVVHDLHRVAAALVDDPHQVEVAVDHRSGHPRLHLRVAPSDMGAVIGRQGRIAKAMRALLDHRGELVGEDYELKIEAGRRS